MKLLKSISKFTSITSQIRSTHSKCIKCGFYSKDVEQKINEQIALELRGAYTYMSMFCHFARSDVALIGCEKFFRQCADEERQHAMKLCDYQTHRGGSIELMSIEQPEKRWYTVSDAFVGAACLEHSMTKKLIEVKETAERCDDDVSVDFIVNEFIRDQVRNSIGTILDSIISSFTSSRIYKS